MIKFLDLQAITMMHGDEIKAALNQVVESGWFLQGKENQQFEADYARYIGTTHCVAVANGLDALKLILRGYKEMGVMQDGDEIIVPANTYIATILAITENNLVPVLVEPTFEHLEIDIDQIEQHITPKTKGVMTVHLYGRIAYNEKLRDITGLCYSCAGQLWQSEEVRFQIRGHEQSYGRDRCSRTGCQTEVSG